MHSLALHPPQRSSGLSSRCLGSGRKELGCITELNHYLVILSTNEKQTPISSWDDARSGVITLELVRCAYRQVVSWMANPNDRDEKLATNAPHLCRPAKSQWFGVRTSKALHWAGPEKSEDGSYYRYRPEYRPATSKIFVVHWAAGGKAPTFFCYAPP